MLTEEQKAARKEKAESAVQGMIDKKFEPWMAKNDAERKTLTENHETMCLQIEAMTESMKAHNSIGLPGAEDAVEKGKFKYSRFVYGLLTKDLEKFAPQEYDYIKEMHKAANKGPELDALDRMLKTQQLGSDITGGYLVAPQIAGELIEDLRDMPRLAQLGAQTIANIGGSEFQMPKKTSAATIAQYGEGTAPSASTINFGQVTMRPHRSKGLVRVSKDLAMLANPDVENIVRNDLLLGHALNIDALGWRGTGAANQPTGLVNQGTGLNTSSFSSGAVTMALLHTFPDMIEQDLALKDGGRFAFVFNPRTLAVIRQLTNAVTGDYFFRPDAWDSAKPTILGYPFTTSNQVPKNLTVGAVADLAEVYFGNWAEAILGYWGGLEIVPITEGNLASTDAAVMLDEVWFYSVMRWDIMFRHNQSFTICSDCSS